MTSKFIDLPAIPPNVRAIFEEWAADYDAAPAGIAAAAGIDTAESAGFYRALAMPAGTVAMPCDTLLGLYMSVLSNLSGPPDTGIPDEAKTVSEWLNPIMAAHFPNLPAL